jgi:CheY-like chemotaxis protein
MASQTYDVLMVDDQSDHLLLHGELLRTNGLTVLVASDATRALELLDQNIVRSILLDINLAGEDGLTLMDFLSTNYPKLPILLYTGLEHDDDQVKSMLERGAVCYVSKGQPPRDLISAIKEILARKPGNRK